MSHLVPSFIVLDLLSLLEHSIEGVDESGLEMLEPQINDIVLEIRHLKVRSALSSALLRFNT